MATPRKVQIVEELTQLLSENRYVVATDYRGLTVVQMSELRRQLREIAAEYHVVKNNLVRFAAQRSGKEGLVEVLKGPVALAFSSEDIARVAKTLLDYARVSKTNLSIKGGLAEGRALNGQEISRLATLPPVEVLRARLLGVMEGPLFALQNVLSANIHGLYSVLNSRMQQLGGTADA